MEYLTIEGQKLLQQELAYLTKEKRVELAEELKYATSLGDLRENSEYDAVVEDYIKTEKKIAEIEHQLSTSKLYKKKNNGTVEITSIVTLEIDGELEEYQIVGLNEFDILKNKISYKSELGKLLLGKKINNIVCVNTGFISYNAKIVEIK